eukprot:TRINITY_DN7208_c0_g1_i1.p1 TRINITY_DN7208_c0_g1~~TRINITY_DN7208_c0_g1_i1.p1  ORF type:complete len:160 (+),score=42.95 TRINITY_DN7208_c0_g1_i1:54-533(+)
MIRRPPRSTLSSSSAASDVYKRQVLQGRDTPLPIAMHKVLSAVAHWFQSILLGIYLSPHGPPPRVVATVVTFALMPLFTLVISITLGILKFPEEAAILIAATAIVYTSFLQTSSAAIMRDFSRAVSYTHLRAHETPEHLVCRLLLEKKKQHSFVIRLLL